MKWSIAKDIGMFLGMFAGLNSPGYAESFADGYSRFSGRMYFDLYYYDQSDSQGSPPATVPTLSFQPEYYKEWNNGDMAMSFIPFLRITKHGNTDSIFDIRELNLSVSKDDWSFRAGVDREFWGVTESVNLVDVINQIDLSGDLGGIQKLGQPMLKTSYNSDMGEFSAYVLPYFRERYFPDPDSALGSIPAVDEDAVEYESSRENKHIDWAARWIHTIGNVDVALSYFNGTDRTPFMRLAPNDQGEIVLIPKYYLIQQAGVEFQYTKGSWLLKLEAIRARSRGKYYSATVAGVEYVFPSLFDSRSDLSLFAEYLYDSRGALATTPFEKDMMFGGRLNLNDDQGSEVFMGVVKDIDTSGAFYTVQASRRIGSKWRIAFQGRIYDNIPVREQLFGVHRVSFANIQISRYF
jgi:hypothetical protein